MAMSWFQWLIIGFITAVSFLTGFTPDMRNSMALAIGGGMGYAIVSFLLTWACCWYYSRSVKKYVPKIMERILYILALIGIGFFSIAIIYTAWVGF
jgi:hypothetical protein